jgi:PKD repeat protein
VTDNSGATASTTKTVTATAKPLPPLASFTASMDNLTGSFDASGSSDPDGTITDYAWDFGDGATSTRAAPNHTYTTAGSYPVTLTVTDNSGATASTTKTVTATQSALTMVAGSSEGSSNPTFYSNSHRLAATARGRLLAVHGLHAQGVQLAWKDSSSAKWSRSSRGDVANGLLLAGTGTGDWPASITVAKDPTGQETAVVVWGGPNFGAARPLQMRVLSDLDAPGGPQVGPIVTLASPSLGTARPDVGTEVAPDGEIRVLVTWTERVTDSAYTVMAAWLDDYSASTPKLVSATALIRDSAANKTATVATTPRGARVAARADGGRLRVYGHDSSAGLTQWWSSGAGYVVPSVAYPSAVGLDSGDVLVAATRDATLNTVSVQRFGGAGQLPTTETELTGYQQPSIALDGSGVRLVAIRSTDGYIVSRYGKQGAWEVRDRVEIGAEGGGNYAWPNALSTTAGGVRLVVRGPLTTTSRSSVLAYERS